MLLHRVGEMSTTRGDSALYTEVWSKIWIL